MPSTCGRFWFETRRMPSDHTQVYECYFGSSRKLHKQWMKLRPDRDQEVKFTLWAEVANEKMDAKNMTARYYWATQTDLMKQYDEPRFACGQAQQWKWVELAPPALRCMPFLTPSDNGADFVTHIAGWSTMTPKCKDGEQMLDEALDAHNRTSLAPQEVVALPLSPNNNKQGRCTWCTVWRRTLLTQKMAVYTSNSDDFVPRPASMQLMLSKRCITQDPAWWMCRSNSYRRNTMQVGAMGGLARLKDWPKFLGCVDVETPSQKSRSSGAGPRFRAKPVARSGDRKNASWINTAKYPLLSRVSFVHNTLIHQRYRSCLGAISLTVPALIKPGSRSVFRFNVWAGASGMSFSPAKPQQRARYEMHVGHVQPLTHKITMTEVCGHKSPDAEYDLGCSNYI
ncbi:hypothetical protein C8R43DRAFT_955211 [Mycena crocata]|nr:hypothetical protein C8R43DRAFT_955211 [Mycena crocata]